MLLSLKTRRRKPCMDVLRTGTIFSRMFMAVLSNCFVVVVDLSWYLSSSSTIGGELLPVTRSLSNQWKKLSSSETKNFIIFVSADISEVLLV